MEYLLAFIIGWCGTYWPRRFPGGGSGPVDPGDPWPPNCPMCGALLGGIAAVILEAAIGKDVGTTFFEDAAIWFFTGAFASSLVGGLMSLGGRSRVTTTRVNG